MSSCQIQKFTTLSTLFSHRYSQNSVAESQDGEPPERGYERRRHAAHEGQNQADGEDRLASFRVREVPPHAAGPGDPDEVRRGEDPLHVGVQLQVAFRRRQHVPHGVGLAVDPEERQPADEDQRQVVLPEAWTKN